MISSIGFIENSKERSLSKFTPNESVRKRLDYLQIPIISDGLPSSVEEPIVPSDEVLFVTPNTEETSNLAFYGYNTTEMFFHHDLFVFSTVLGSCSLGDGGVAVATFEPDIFVYDPWIDFPLLPQSLLVGHSDAVTAVKNKDRMMSISEDTSFIEWDISTLSAKSTRSLGIPLHTFDFDQSVLAAASSNNYVVAFSEDIIKTGSLEESIETVVLTNSQLLVSDSCGFVSVFDLRSLDTKLLHKQLHDGSVLDMIVVGSKVITTGMDKFVRIWDLNWNLLKEENVKSVVYCLGYNTLAKAKMNEVFCGDEENEVYPISLE